jgi:hypothetical protein
LSEGSHAIAVVARDDSGKAASAMVRFKVDTTPPEMTGIAGGWPHEGSCYSTAEVFFASGSFAVNEPSTISCSVDAGPWTGCPPTSTMSYPILGLFANGKHTLRVRATDGAGNSSEIPLRSFAVNAATVDISSPVDGSTLNGGSAQLVFSLSPSPLLPEDPSCRYLGNNVVASATCRLDFGPEGPCVSGQEFSGLSEGLHQLTVRTKDEDGFYAFATVKFVVDTGSPAGPAPVVNIDSPSEGSIWTTRDIYVRATTTNEGATIECKLDDGPYTACSWDRVYYKQTAAYVGLRNGEHELTVRATGAFGISETRRHFTVAVPFVPAPSVFIGSPVVGATTSSEVSFSFGAVDDVFSSRSGMFVYTCQLDAGVSLPCWPGHTYSALSAGKHTFTVKASEQGVGTVGSASVVFTVDPAQ